MTICCQQSPLQSVRRRRHGFPLFVMAPHERTDTMHVGGTEVFHRHGEDFTDKFLVMHHLYSTFAFVVLNPIASIYFRVAYSCTRNTSSWTNHRNVLLTCPIFTQSQECPLIKFDIIQRMQSSDNAFIVSCIYGHKIMEKNDRIRC